MDIIVRPIFNVLTTIYALIPGHNFGVAIIVFTIVVRFVMYPLLKRQLKHSAALKRMQPEIKNVKKKAKGDRQKEALLMSQLYKEHDVKPVAFIGLMVVQVVIFLALFSGINRIVNDPTQVYEYSYPIVQQLPAMQEINEDPSKFDNTLFGVVDLNKAAYSGGELYMPAMIIVLASAVVQFLSVKQTMPKDKNARGLRQILKEASEEQKPADSAEVNAAVGQKMAYVMPLLIFFITIPFAAALPLYWLVSGIVAYFQQRHLLKQPEYSMTVATAEVVSKKPLKEEKKAPKTPKQADHAGVEHLTTTKSGVKVSRVTNASSPNKNTPKNSKKSKKKRKKR